MRSAVLIYHWILVREKATFMQTNIYHELVLHQNPWQSWHWLPMEYYSRHQCPQKVEHACNVMSTNRLVKFELNCRKPKSIYWGITSWKFCRELLQALCHKHYWTPCGNPHLQWPNWKDCTMTQHQIEGRCEIPESSMRILMKRRLKKK